jgi:hypothetical protein
MMIEMSFHLVEPIIYSSLTAAVSAPGSTAVTVGSLGIPINALYVGAQLIVDWGTVNQEIVTVTNVNQSASAFTAVFTFAHAIGATVIGATFPVQASSGDYFFSQSEILSYIARAQNEYLAEVPCILQLNTQFAQFGQIYQQLACDAIEFHHASSSAMYVTLTSLTRSGNAVTAVSVSPHGMVQGQKFSAFNTLDPSFVGAFTVATVVNPTTLTYAQDAPNASTTGGALVRWKRLYLTSQEELSIQNPFWRNQNITEIHSVYEDRTGNYRFGIDGKLSTNLPLEILVSTRDTDSLAMTDGLLVPDVVAHIPKYRALGYAASKDGEMKNPLLEKYCEMRFRRGVMATRR